MNDDVINDVMQDFEERLKSPALQKIVKQAKGKNANFNIANRYALEVNKSLNASLKKYASSQNVEMKFDILSQFFGEGLKREYDLISQVTSIVQTRINKRADVGLKPIKPTFNADKVRGLTKYFTRNPYDADVINELILKRIHEYTDNFAMSVVDDAIHDNAEFHSDAGLKATITRIASADACEWCANLAGVYDYEDVKETGNPVFMRHRQCTCEVLYSCEKNKYTNVHDKKTQYDTDQVNRMIQYSRATNAEFFSKDAKQRRIDLAKSLEKRLKR